ncbi:RHS repeat domain-containing protein [Chitinophaga sp. Hz27]|uniref:RHS repeat domain-containing protein n=1 Tax=Chitinophaga sp. Hz27 TaxID=3347169 RepID=UPI0035D99CC2
MNKSGFLYIYTSNESASDVYFDNLLVAQASGPVLEETHYYPFGLTMAGISSNALKGSNYPENRKKFNGNELQSGEFSDGSGLDLYDFNARTYDPQIGKFLQIDPLIESEQESLSPYHFSRNNPVLFSDPDGKFPILLVIPVILELGEIAFGASEAYEVLKLGHTIYSGSVLLSKSTAKNGAKPRGMEDTPAEKDETAIKLPAPDKAIDGKSQPQVSEETAKELEKLQPLPIGSQSKGSSSKNEKHGDAGRAQTKADKQIAQYREQLKTATGKLKKQIEQKVKNVQKDAAQKAKGEEHSRANKR